MQRVARVKAWDQILSSYQPGSKGGGVGGPRETLLPLYKLGAAAFITPDTHEALIELHDAVQGAGGDFRVTDAFRDIEVQAAARKKYENWLNAGKPLRSDPLWDAETMKDAPVSKPGYSFHNTGRAIDVDIARLNFPGLSWDKQLDKLWELAVPLGWSPIISRPEEGQKEAWHFDFYGPWSGVKERLDYNQTAMCAALDIGSEVYDRFDCRFIQAQLQRAGYDVGDVDGWWGNKTENALIAAKIDSQLIVNRFPATQLQKAVANLPTNTGIVWRP